MVGAGRHTLVTFRPRLLVVLAMLEAEEVALMAEVEAIEKAAEGWSAVEFSTLVCWRERHTDTKKGG